MSSRGFTKIEILVVSLVALIIIIIDVFVVLYLNTKQRDVQVLSEISQIRSGLETFLLYNNFYPNAPSPVALNDDYANTEKLCADGFKKISAQCQKNILNPVPNFYFSQDNTYTYKSSVDNKNYQIEFNLRTNFKKLGLQKGKNCATNTQLASQACF